MTDPEALIDAPRVFLRLQTLRKRPDFLLAARARRSAQPGMIVQGRNRLDADDLVRVGYTCSKKVGNAVARNRAKRRLREVARLVLPVSALPGWDYILIGRYEATASRPFDALQDDLRRALTQMHPK